MGVDLVFTEYVDNEYRADLLIPGQNCVFQHPVRGYESLVRRVLQLPSQPALVMMQASQARQAGLLGQKGGWCTGVAVGCHDAGKLSKAGRARGPGEKCVYVCGGGHDAGKQKWIHELGAPCECGGGITHTHTHTHAHAHTHTHARAHTYTHDLYFLPPPLSLTLPAQTLIPSPPPPTHTHTRR